MAYTPNKKTKTAWDAYLQTARDKPGDYTSDWTERARELYQGLADYKPYQYDPASDPVFQQYREQYAAGAAEGVAQSTVLASGMTGGYGSTYGGAVGQQTYNNYMDRRNDIMPEFEQNAYSRYRGERADATALYGMAQGSEYRDYGRYRDTMGDYQANRQTAYGMYADQRNFDYGSMVDDRNYNEAQRQAASGGGGRGRGTAPGEPLPLDAVLKAYYTYQNRGEDGLLKYLDELEKAGVPSEALADLYLSTQKDTTPIDWEEHPSKYWGTGIGGGR